MNISMNRGILISIVIAVAALLIGTYVFSVTNPKTAKAPTPPELESIEPAVMSGRYIAYSKEAFDAAADLKRVYYFWASWCPTCKTSNQEFLTMSDQIPQDVILFKTNYDTEEELKKKYGVTYQHTFVQVDTQGNEVAKWNGGGIKELTEKIK